MKKILYLLPILFGLAACRAQPQPTPNIAEIVNATLTAIAQKNTQVVTQPPASTSTPFPAQPIFTATPFPAQPIFTATPFPVQVTPLNQVTPVVSSISLSVDQLRQGTYRSPDWGEFKLSDGIYYRTPTTAQESPETYTTQLMGTILRGDINSDGFEDAVVFLFTQNGGTGHFVEMAAVLNLNGTASNISTLYLGVESGSIQNGLITLNLLVHGPNDGECCPSQSAVENFRLDNGKLVQIP